MEMVITIIITQEVDQEDAKERTHADARIERRAETRTKRRADTSNILNHNIIFLI